MVSVLVVTWNSAATIGRCLAAVQAAAPPESQCIVWDNGSTDASVSTAQAAGPFVHVIAAGENLGFAAGTNRASIHASGDFLLILNPDAYVGADSIRALVAASEAGGGAIAGGLVRTEGCPQMASARPFPSAHSLVSWLLTGRPPAWRLPRERTPVDAVSGAFMLVPQKLWTRLGGFDESYPHSSEDIDLCWRARRAGAQVVYEPRASVDHDLGASVRQAPPSIDALRWIGLHQFIRRSRGCVPAALLKGALGLRLITVSILLSLGVGRSPHRLQRTRALRKWVFQGIAPALPTAPVAHD